jgi:hypothetical protein
MYKFVAPTLILASLLAGCSASQPPGADLPWRSDASINVGEYRLAARGTMTAEDVVSVELRFVRVGDPSRIIAAPSMLVRTGETGEVMVDDGSTGVSALVKTGLSGSKVMIEIDATIVENGITRSQPRIRFAIDPSSAEPAMASNPAS